MRIVTAASLGVVATGLWLLSGCGGGDDSGGAGGATGGCNTLVNDGGDVPELAATGAPPTMTGGAIADGTYVLTARQDWQGSCNCTTRQKLVVAAGQAQLVQHTDSAPDLHLTAALTTSGNALSLKVSCPAATTMDLLYTATATEIQVFDPKDQSLNVFTKQ